MKAELENWLGREIPANIDLKRIEECYNKGEFKKAQMIVAGKIK